MEAHASIMQETYDGATLTSKHIIDSFQRAYKQVYGREAQVVHMFAEWYTINGETVHRITLFNEIKRLNELVREQQAQQAAFRARQAAIEAEQAALQAQQLALQAQQVALQTEQAALQMQQTVRSSAPDRSIIQRLISRLRRA